jgi:hypothetical protein
MIRHVLTTAALSGGPLIPVVNVKSGTPRSGGRGR